MTFPLTISIPNLEALPRAAEQLLQVMQESGCSIAAFFAPMGAGKTTLINELCRLQGAPEVTNSPTFALVNEYSSAVGAPIYHIDCYRLRDEAEAVDMGITDFLYSGHTCYVEWPELVEDLLPPAQTLSVSIEAAPGGERTLTIMQYTLSHE